MPPPETFHELQKRSPSRRWTSAILLFLPGLAAWPFIFDGVQPAFLGLGPLGPQWLFVFALIVGAIAWIPPIAGPVDRLLIRLAVAAETRTILYSILAGICSTAYLALTAWGQRRKFFPIMHDEFSYLIQAHQLARGHLWMPAHPLADFFDSFQLLTRPVYASVYFPGTALLQVPGIWLHLPAYCTSLAIAGAIAGLLFWICVRLAGGLHGWLAVALLLSDGLYRQLSIMTLAQLPLLLFGLLASIAWLHWRANDSRKSAVLIGAFLGLAAITRPVDALCFAVPIFLAMLLHQRRKQIVLLVAGSMPFLLLQLILNHGITGHWTQTPFGFYADRDYPGTSYGFHPPDPSAAPVSTIEQKRLLFRSYLPLLREHRLKAVLKDLFPGRLRTTLSQVSPVPYPLLALLLPLALLQLTRSRAVMLGVVPLFLLLYAPYVFFLPHYVAVVAPALILAILLGVKAIQAISGKCRRFTTVGLTLFVAGQAVAALPQWSPARTDDAFDTPILASVNQQLGKLGSSPAVVLFKFDPHRNLHEEPVYNSDTAWPDDARIIRAHDLGAENAKIIEYYAKVAPDREIYRFDEAALTLDDLGSARLLAAKK